MRQKALAALLFLGTVALVLAQVRWFPGFHPGRR